MPTTALAEPGLGVFAYGQIAWWALVIFCYHACSHHDSPKTTTRIAAASTPAAMNPVMQQEILMRKSGFQMISISRDNSEKNPLDWSHMNQDEGQTSLRRLPVGTWVRDSEGTLRQIGFFAGHILNPYRGIDWSNSAGYNNLPMYSLYIDPQGLLRQKLPRAAATPTPAR
jgi:hypothetical protein